MTWSGGTGSACLACVSPVLSGEWYVRGMCEGRSREGDKEGGGLGEECVLAVARYVLVIQGILCGKQQSLLQTRFSFCMHILPYSYRSSLGCSP